jgi:hypothetical protein
MRGERKRRKAVSLKCPPLSASLATAAFDRSLKRLAKKHSDIPGVFGDLLTILDADPLTGALQQNPAVPSTPSAPNVQEKKSPAK